MNTYLFEGNDKENSLDIRMSNRNMHLEFLNNCKEYNVNLKIAAPIINANNEMCGSILILEADNLQAIENFIQNDPYNKAGLFQTTKITTIKIGINNY